MQTECLLEGGADCTLDVRVRFLHVVGARGGARGRATASSRSRS